jgi:hypothetical protein
LGFKETAKGTETPYGYLSRRNSDNDFPMDIIWGSEDLTPSPSPSASSSSSSSSGTSTKSKNKKKKKKTKKQ